MPEITRDESVIGRHRGSGPDEQVEVRALDRCRHAVGNEPCRPFRSSPADRWFECRRGGPTRLLQRDRGRRRGCLWRRARREQPRTDQRCGGHERGLSGIDGIGRGNWCGGTGHNVDEHHLEAGVAHHMTGATALDIRLHLRLGAIGPHRHPIRSRSDRTESVIARRRRSVWRRHRHDPRLGRIRARSELAADRRRNGHPPTRAPIPRERRSRLLIHEQRSATCTDCCGSPADHGLPRLEVHRYRRGSEPPPSIRPRVPRDGGRCRASRRLPRGVRRNGFVAIAADDDDLGAVPCPGRAVQAMWIRRIRQSSPLGLRVQHSAVPEAPPTHGGIVRRETTPHEQLLPGPDERRI